MYQHTQFAPLHWILHVVAVSLFAAAMYVPIGALQATLGVAALVVLIMAFSFRSLTIEGREHGLHVRFGPIPAFRKRIAYADIDSVHMGRTTLVDGWGIHWIPGRGWTWNLWGFECVVLTGRFGALRLGTDDPHGLAAFLQARLPIAHASSERSP